MLLASWSPWFPPPPLPLPPSPLTLPLQRQACNSWTISERILYDSWLLGEASCSSVDIANPAQRKPCSGKRAGTPIRATMAVCIWSRYIFEEYDGVAGNFSRPNTCTTRDATSAKRPRVSSCTKLFSATSRADRGTGRFQGDKKLSLRIRV